MNYSLKCIITNVCSWHGIEKGISISIGNIYLCHITNIKDFNVKSKPVLGGRMPLPNVTSYPDSIVCALCVSVTDLGFGFLIWLKDV